MADIAQLERALINADAAGDFEAAKAFASEIRRIRSIPIDPVEQPKDDSSILGNIAAGLVRGAGSIGSTILAPYDIAKDAIAGKGLSLESNKERRHAIDMGLSGMGADPESIAYQGGKLAGEIAGTAGSGGVLAKAPLLSKVPGLAQAIESGGMVAGKAPMATRAIGGAVTGATQAAMVNPEDAPMGAALGGGVPLAAKAGGELGKMASKGMRSVSEDLMTSALKPTLKQKQTGEAAKAVKTLLDEGLNVTGSGVESLKSRISDLNNQIEGKIAYSNAMVDRPTVMSALNPVKDKFGNQVSRTADLGSIQNVADDFANHPSWIFDKMPVQAAQEIKQGTYRVLDGKYGQLGSAETEAQKALARGLKEAIADAVPEVRQLNSKESDLIKALKVTERRVLMDANKNPMGLAALAHNPLSWAAFMADRSNAFKSVAARMANATSQQLNKTPGLLESALSQPVLRSGGLLAIESSP